MKKKYKFTPSVKKNDTIFGGSILGSVQETPLLTHNILVPPNYPEATITEIAKEGDYDLEQVIGHASSKNGDKIELKMYHKWPVRKPRPYAERYDPSALN